MSRALFMGLLCIGCATTRSPASESAETIHVVKLTPSFGEEGHGQLEIELTLDNAHGADQLDGFHCEIYLNDRWFAASEGLLDRPLTAEAHLPVRLVVPWSLRRSGAPASAAEKVGVEVRGELRVSHAGTVERIAFKRWTELMLRGGLVPTVEDTL